MRVPDNVFRAYDIRGIVDEQLTRDFARGLGRAFASRVRQEVETPTLAVGQDNRPSSGPLADALAEGMTASGADVLRVGTVPTPGLYFADHHFDADGSVQITGSHNPPEYNGFKMVLGGGPFYGDEVQALRQRMIGEDFAEGSGREEERPDLLDRYVEAVADRSPLPEPVSVVLDCGNGAGSVAAPDALRAAGADVECLYCESDGTFPNHHPDPTVDENLEDLIDRVRSTGADLGVALDGDADRVGAVTGEGEIVRGDHLLLLLALDVLENRPGAPVIFDVKCSQAVPEMIREAGGEPVMWKTGHSLIKEKMRQTSSPISGEMSGHIFFADNWFGFDDAIYASARLARLVARSGRSLGDLLGDVPRYPSTPELRLDCPEEEKFEVVREAVEHYRGSHEVVDVDGARVQFDGGWALIRASNTQPVVVVRLEADSRERLAEIRDDVAALLGGHGIEVPRIP
ncbi:MAG: phosphomannomutase/phosphoglucomutase [Candidatus Palauibacterales bacterium]|nr:phosphomannomutase/phosphoglucomutase [Candidatus Palauibacterales bacterium]